MRYPICMNCDYGMVQQRESNGTQDPSITVFCRISMEKVAADLSFCSQQSTPLFRTFKSETAPIPLYVNASNKNVKETVAKVLSILLKAKLNP